jgi:hypothetical protein
MEFDYNTIRSKLILPEYGRNIQQMVNDVCAIENAEERNKAARVVISIMGNMNPHLRDVPDFKHKLWDHLFIMSNFTLEIDSPYPRPTPESISEKPKTVPYTSSDIKFKHYGKTIEMMIHRAVDMPEGEEKEVLLSLIANHMKKSYLTWNREAVTDEVIFQDLVSISGDRISMRADMRLSETKEILARNKKRHMPVKNNNMKKGHK